MTFSKQDSTSLCSAAEDEGACDVHVWQLPSSGRVRHWLVDLQFTAVGLCCSLSHKLVRGVRVDPAELELEKLLSSPLFRGGLPDALAAEVTAPLDDGLRGIMGEGGAVPSDLSVTGATGAVHDT